MKKYKYILYILFIAFILVGCSKTEEDVKASDEVNEPKSAKEVLEKSVQFYKNQNLKSLVIDAKSTITSNNKSENNVEIAVVDYTEEMYNNDHKYIKKLIENVFEYNYSKFNQGMKLYLQKLL